MCGAHRRTARDLTGSMLCWRTPSVDPLQQKAAPFASDVNLQLWAMARDRACICKSVFCSKGNQPALDLYVPRHYTITHQASLYQRPYGHLVKMFQTGAETNHSTP